MWQVEESGSVQVEQAGRLPARSGYLWRALPGMPVSKLATHNSQRKRFMGGGEGVKG